MNAFCKTGAAADAIYSQSLPLKVISLGDKFILGTTNPDGTLLTRESVTTFDTAQEAETAIETGDFVQALSDVAIPPSPQDRGPEVGGMD